MGPSGDVDRARAGDEGEYHHSRNLMKKMIVGRMTLKDSTTRRGDLDSTRRKAANNPLGCEAMSCSFDDS